MDINFFNHNAFSSEVMTKAIENYEFKPNLIGSLNLFEEVETVRTVIGIGRCDNKLSLIPTNKCGEPLIEVAGGGRQNIWYFKTTPIIKEYIIKAEEIKDWREFGIEDQFETVTKFIAKKQKKLISEIELIWENMQLGAIQGVVLDADGSVIYDCYEEWGITPPEPINFMLNTETISVSDMVNQVVTKILEVSGGAFSDYSRIIGLCGHEFFSKLKDHKIVREIYLAQILNNAKSISKLGAIGFEHFDSFDFEGVTFINYRNIHNYNMNAKSNIKRSIGIKPSECQFVPINVPGVFQKAFAPEESQDFTHTIGKPLYTRLIVVDHVHNAWVRLKMSSYPLFVCVRPEMLFKAVVRAK
ncbi:major capsid protein [Bartonella schoenbuchensis]|uniref:Phage protein n=1 Tax=Bartonella schoenbuchensis m07a TaxID=1094496 RepID=N6VEY3_9HYPH|nr:major capsid protein [Bartonella schoenbuchensis]ENN91826.1 phage protein [Bartonella schoenbuchensis m07a]